VIPTHKLTPKQLARMIELARDRISELETALQEIRERTRFLSDDVSRDVGQIAAEALKEKK
jgi:hypothetical protein